MIDILGRRYLFFVISLLVIIPGIIILLVWGAPLAIDFTGGSLLEVRFDEGKMPQPSLIVQLFEKYDVEDVKVQTTGEGTVVIRSSFMDESTRSQIISSMEDEFSSSVTMLRSDSVGPTIGQEVTNRAAVAVSLAAIAVIIYITFAFRGVQHAVRYGICAIIAMIHDVAVVVSLMAIGGHFFGWQLDSLFLTALLTVIGFSVQDKIVVF
ncbi:MAG: protein translocase subunit SecF, partial [Anaerolineales bacterium]